MKRLVSLCLIGAFVLCGCQSKQVQTGESAQDQTKTEAEAAVEEGAAGTTLFPATDALVGDTMPYFENGTMNVFYLADQRDGKTGYHPWGLITTQDYSTYSDEGIVLPYGETAEDQDIALGTGCVMKDQEGLYHAFYTGHNDFYSPKEAIMHATSTDMMNWTKIPEDTFTASEPYSTQDFRDPYVFYVEEDQCYWMLVVTRTVKGGVIVKYTSRDLSKWKDEGIFFEDDLGYGTNMECPSVLEYNGTWYLAFSDQWPDRVVHYRISDSLKGEFKKPEKDTFDGNGFYAGRLETDGENLYIVGWNGTKVSHDDFNDYDWGGNMVVHQMAQQSDGTLKPVVNPMIVEKISKEADLTPVVMTDTVGEADGGYQMAGDQYELIQFNRLEGSSRVEMDIADFQDDEMFGIAFAPDSEQVGNLNYIFNVKESRIEFYNTDEIFDTDAQSFIDYDFSGKDEIHVTMLADGGVVCLFVDGEVALTTRMYRAQSSNWQLVGINSDVTWTNLALYH